MRPYFSSSITELVESAESHWAEPNILCQLLRETELRTSKRARTLRRDLEERIQYLSSESSAASGAYVDVDPESERLTEAEKRILDLEGQLNAAMSTGRSGADMILFKWGLAASCPPAVFESVKRAWRKNLHPDAHTDRNDADRRELERQFQDFEQDMAWLRENGWPPI